MHIRCFCGNDTMLHDGEDGRPRLYDRSWFDEEKKRVRCPKCGSDALAMSLAGEAPAEGPIPVILDAKAAYAKRRIEYANRPPQPTAEAETPTAERKPKRAPKAAPKETGEDAADD